jgi:hypothetical protein
MNAGHIGGIIGLVVGLAGGLVGSYLSIKSAKGSRLRRFMIASNIGCFAYVSSFLAVFLLVPEARTWIWLPYAIVLAPGLRFVIRNTLRIRREEQRIA